MSVWDEFDKSVNSDEMKEAIKEAAANGGGRGNFPEVPDGNYKVIFDKIEPSESRNHQPMIKIRARIQEGQYKKQCLFHNLYLRSEKGAAATAYCLQNAAEWLAGLEAENADGELIDLDPKNLSYQLFLDLAEAVDSMQLTYLVHYYHDNGYSRLEIVDILG